MEQNDWLVSGLSWGSNGQAHSILGTADASWPSRPLLSLGCCTYTILSGNREGRSPGLPGLAFPKRKVTGQGLLEYHDMPRAIYLLSHLLTSNKSMTE